MLTKKEEARYWWLIENVGGWECVPDHGTWWRKFEDGKWQEAYSPKVRFCAFGTSFAGCSFEEALDKAMELYPDGHVAT